LLEEGKEYLVETRLGPIAKAEGCANVTELIGRLRWQSLPTLVERVVEALTTNETLFFRVLMDNLEALAPFVYTPTVGQVCLRFGSYFRRARGMYVSSGDRGLFSSMVHNWPLDDPSLAGTPLQYHYFMMVHAAAASGTIGVEITLVLLRLMVVPLGAVLVAQAYMLGRQVARSPWGGAIAALLVVMAGEMSFAANFGQPMYLGLFARWLFVSPTFFFGMIFCGALLLAIAHCDRLARCGVQHHIWLFLLAAAGTGAKRTVLPVLICALGLWAGWRWVHERRFPGRLVAFGCGLSAGFAVVYLATMSSWQTGDARFNPFHVFQLTEFWKTYLPVWQQALGHWLPAAVALPLATLGCALVVFAGTCGVRLLAIPYLCWSARPRRDPLVGWLGAFFFASTGMGLLMELNSYGELYLILMIRLPMAVLAAAGVVDVARRFQAWRSQAVPWLAPELAPPVIGWVRRGLGGAAVLVLVLALMVFP
jgi:hypothetical protein